MVKVFCDPVYRRADQGDGGIRRVTEALVKYLPEFGIECVADPYAADVINNHGTALTYLVDNSIPLVHSGHGLMWTDIPWDDWAHTINAQVVESMARSIAHTAPSEWVAQALRRGMYVYPEVIYHGVDSELWTPGNTQPYVLWNKARIDQVSDPNDMLRVAARLPTIKFVSTFGTELPNVKLTGPVNVERMREMVRSAGVYLATARETFGIGTLEALACGVPVAGWAWGGQLEIVLEGVTGYLAPPGDYDALADCITRCINERTRLSANCRADAIERWQWKPRIEQYANLFKRVVSEWQVPRPRVSVIVPCHNLGRFLGDALDSVKAQSFSDYECLIIDDHSQDNTPAIAQQYADLDPRFVYHRTPSNLKLPGTLNYGASKARGRYLINLDADNMLDPDALQVLAGALDADNSLHIVYGHLDVLSSNGVRTRNSWPFKQFDWHAQLNHLNQITSSALVRREVWERSGGYRLRQWRAEDAEYWSRVTSLGFRARKVTELATLIYRDRPDSKSKGEGGDGNWVAWLPWAGGGNAHDGSRAMRSGTYLPHPTRVPFGAQGKPQHAKFWDCPPIDKPQVSVIIPCAPAHMPLLIDALDSIRAQSFTNWEVIVVIDDVTAPSNIIGAPFAKVYCTGKVKCGPGVARNMGAKLAKSPLLYFLDADDYLLPDTLQTMIREYNKSNRLVYGDWLRNDSDGREMLSFQARDFECATNGLDIVQWDLSYPVKEDPTKHKTEIVSAARGILGMMSHSVNVLVPKAYHDKIGGFDETMHGWEDWDYFIALQDAGLCSVRVPEPLFVYRFHKGERRNSSYADGKALKDYLFNKWRVYYSGEKNMGCGCSNSGITSTPPIDAQLLSPAGDMSMLTDDSLVLLEYTGAAPGPMHYRGHATETLYKFGHGEHSRKLVAWNDAQQFLSLPPRKGVVQFTLAQVEPPPTPQAVVNDYIQATVSETPQAPEWPVMGQVESSDEIKAIADLFTLPITQAVPHISTLSVRQLRFAITGADPMTLLTWLQDERKAEQPRKVVVSELIKALNSMQPESETI